MVDEDFRHDVPHSWIGQDVQVTFQQTGPAARRLVDVGDLGFTLQIEEPSPPASGYEGSSGLEFYPWSTVESMRLLYPRSVVRRD